MFAGWRGGSRGGHPVQGFFRLANGMLTRIANALELEPNYRVLYALGQAIVFHRGRFGPSFMSTPVTSGWAVRVVRASSKMTVSARFPNPTDFPLSPSLAWPKTTTVTGGLTPMLGFWEFRSAPIANC